MSDTQQPVNPPLPLSPTELPNFLIQEYNALRAEILKRTEIQHQLLSFAVIASGTFLTIAFKDDGSRTVVLVYPILSMFLSIAWCHSDILIRQIGTYIRKRIEGRFLGNTFEGKLLFGWEAHLHALRSADRSRLDLPLVVALGIFVGTQVLLVGTFFIWAVFSDHPGLSGFSGGRGCLLFLDVVVIVVTTLLLSFRSYFSPQ